MEKSLLHLRAKLPFQSSCGDTFRVQTATKKKITQTGARLSEAFTEHLPTSSDPECALCSGRREMACDRDGTRHNERYTGNVHGMKMCHLSYRCASAAAMPRFSRDRTRRNSSAHGVWLRNLCPSTPTQGKCWTDVGENLFPSHV